MLLTPSMPCSPVLLLRLRCRPSPRRAVVLVEPARTAKNVLVTCCRQLKRPFAHMRSAKILDVTGRLSVRYNIPSLNPLPRLHAKPHLVDARPAACCRPASRVQTLPLALAHVAADPSQCHLMVGSDFLNWGHTSICGPTRRDPRNSGKLFALLLSLLPIFDTASFSFFGFGFVVSCAPTMSSVPKSVAREACR